MKSILNNNQINFGGQIDDHENLFDLVPCIITVQDRNYRILKYNREFSDKFGSKIGDYCYNAYKGRNEKCMVCPLENTFKDGKVHYGEQSGLNKDGTVVHWIVKTAPITNANGEIIAAMEMSINITQQKLLQERLAKSEKKYYSIFNNIPNPVFVLDMQTLEIIDCNESMKSVYGYNKEEIIKKSFLELFHDEDKHQFESILKTTSVLNKAKHINKEGRILFVNIRVSPYEYHDRKVLLVTTSDITQRLETERQLIQTSKLATLGEMASGVAHELNQPLSVIKTASNFFIRKANKKETVDEEIYLTMLSKIDSNIDRAVKIINHMRQFSRKPSLGTENVQITEVVERAFEIFNQQLKLRGIEVVKDSYKNMPLVIGDSNRLEQVFINLLLNARDAIEAKWGDRKCSINENKIFVKIWTEDKLVIVDIGDTGIGIPDDISDKIFEPFFTTKEVGKGTGLGLSISYGIVKDCGGEIAVYKNKFGGASFILAFPIKDSE